MVDSLRSGAPTPWTVRMQLNRVRVFHFDPGKIFSNDSLLRHGALTPSTVSMQLSRVTVFRFDPSRLDEPQLMQRFFVFHASRSRTNQLTGNMTSTS